jgi:uncharacterized protein YjiS (DUF1127 family)
VPSSHGSSATSTTAHFVFPALHQGHRTEGEIEMNIREKIAKFAAYQRTVRELAALDNRQLNDLGITRGDIKNIARSHTL